MSKTSLFYSHHFRTGVVLSFLLLERFAALLEVEPDKESETTVLRCLAQAVKDCTGDSADDEALIACMQRVIALTKKKAEGATELPPAPEKGFAASYSKWLQNLAPADTCLLVAGNDFHLAYSLYCEIDREEMLALAEAKLKDDWEHIKISFESSVYAFGGSLDGSTPGSKSKEVIVDLTKDNPVGLAQLAKML